MWTLGKNSQSLGELSASKLVATPGGETFAHEVFTRMHYGVNSQLAAMCLLLLAMTGVLQFTITAPNDMPRDQRAEYFHRIESAVAATPGVASVGASSIAPFSGGNTNTQFLAEGHDATANEYFAADWRSVTPGFFKTLGVPLLRGRLLEETDTQVILSGCVPSAACADSIRPMPCDAYTTTSPTANLLTLTPPVRCRGAP